LCKEYSAFTSQAYHSYIPLLAVNPAFRRVGHGSTIVQHLIAEAATVTAVNPTVVSDLLLLDVYLANSDAIRLYEKCGFVVLNPVAPIPDPQENNEAYAIMARKVSIATA
jgi:ribosomal protein S18 acetylase RimI-like enzyme